MAPKQLYVWGPAFNVPSIDPRCLVVETYLRFLRIDYTVVHANDPQYSPTGKIHYNTTQYNTIQYNTIARYETRPSDLILNPPMPTHFPLGELPLLKDGNVWVAGATRILAHLAKHNLDANESLSDTEKADSYAYVYSDRSINPPIRARD